MKYVCIYIYNRSGYICKEFPLSLSLPLSLTPHHILWMYVCNTQWFDASEADEIASLEIVANKFENEILNPHSSSKKLPLFGPKYDELKVWGLLTQQEKHQKVKFQKKKQ
jgi:hypothetical protein